MKISHLFLVLIYAAMHLLGSKQTLAQATWQQQANFPGGGRYWCSTFTIGDKIYVGLGYSPTGGSGGASVFYNDFYEYNTTTNTWTQKPSYPGAGRLYVTGFSINGKGYFACGWYNGYQKDLWEYDPVLNAWTQRTDVPGPGRWGAVGFSIGNHGFVVTGDTQGNGQGCINGAYRYDQTSNLWMQLPNFPGTPVYGAAGFSIGNQGYVGTGYDGTVEHDEMYKWDEETYSWSQVADFGGSPRYQNIGFAIGNRGYIGLGSSGNGDLWEYNPATDTWGQTLSYPGQGFNVNAAAATSTAAFIGLGQPANQQWWKYTPQNCITNVAAISADGPLDFCTGETVTLTASPGDSYLWNNGLTAESIVVSQAGDYSVVVQYGDGCNLTASASVSLNALDLPVVEALATQTSLCVGDELTLYGGGAQQYTWSDNVVNGVPFLVDVNSQGTYFVTGTSEDGCSSEDSISILVNPLPDVQLNFDEQAFLCANTGNILLTEGLPAGGVYTGSEVIANEISTDNTGVFEIQYSITDVNGCINAASDAISIEICTSAAQEKELDLQFYPNPARCEQNLNISGNSEINCVQFFDASGRLLDEVRANQKMLKLTLNKLSTGLYFVRVHYAKEVLIRKLILE